MIRKIADRKYNTASARKIASRESEFGECDPRWYRETLYRKISGEFFLYAEGGMNSRYAKRQGGNVTAGSTIIPLEFDRAVQWAVKNMDRDEYIQKLVRPCHDETVSRFSIRLSVGTHEIMRNNAEEQGYSLSSYLEHLILRDNNIDRFAEAIGGKWA